MLDASATQAGHYVHWLALNGFRNPGGALPFNAATKNKQVSEFAMARIGWLPQPRRGTTIQYGHKNNQVFRAKKIKSLKFRDLRGQFCLQIGPICLGPFLSTVKSVDS